MEVTPLPCPACGATRIVYLEDVSSKRRVAGTEPDGRVHVNGYYEVIDEAPSNPRLFCCSCRHEWPIDTNQCEFY